MTMISHAPARIRVGEEMVQSINQAERLGVGETLVGQRALCRCQSIEKNQTSKDHSAPFTFWDHPGCSGLGETEVTMETHASSAELVHLCRLKKASSLRQKHFTETSIEMQMLENYFQIVQAVP